MMIFKTTLQFRKWLEKNHNKVSELWVGIYNQKSNKTSITYKQALDEALCFGWIDGVRKGVDDGTYVVRFTPRKQQSKWSKVNISRVEELTALGRMRPSGQEAFARRPANSAGYSFEERPQGLDPALERVFRKDKNAWEFFQSQAPWYRRATSWWVISAKKEETRTRRLQILIRDSTHGRRIGPLTPRKKSSA